MVDAGFGAQVNDAQLQAILTTQAPPTEAVAAAVGAGLKASRENHVHKRLTSTTVQTLDGSGNATINFTRTFVAMPGVVLTAYKPADNLPITLEVVAGSWIMDGNGEYAGCIIHGSRARTLPSTLSLLSALISYNIFAGDASGVLFSCVAIQVSN